MDDCNFTAERSHIKGMNRALFIWVDPLFSKFALVDVESGGGIDTLAKALISGAKIIVTSHNTRLNCGTDPKWSQISWYQRSTSDAWDDKKFEAEIAAAACSRCIVVGDFVSPSITLCVLGGLKRGYDVYFLNEADPDISAWNVWAAASRLSQAGAVPMCWSQIKAEFEVKLPQQQ